MNGDARRVDGSPPERRDAAGRDRPGPPRRPSRLGADQCARRRRWLLKLSVYPGDIAEAVDVRASDAASKSTGDILNRDAGNATSFAR